MHIVGLVIYLHIVRTLSFTPPEAGPCVRYDLGINSDIILEIHETEDGTTQSELLAYRPRDYRDVVPLYGTTETIALDMASAAYSDHFQFTLINGVYYLQLVRNLDRDGNLFPRDPIESLRFSVSCTVLSTSQVFTYSLRVIIVDVNDHRPEFIQTAADDAVECSGDINIIVDHYHITVTESVPVGEEITSVEAWDGDDWGSLNSKITYIITNVEPVSANASDYFFIGPERGCIVIKKLLTDDIHKTSYFVITVKASDHGQPQKHNSVFVRINVTRNYFPPVFVDDGIYITIVDVDVPGAIIVKLDATDDDIQAPFNTVRYRLPQEQTFFSIEPLTGEVRIREGLQLDTRQVYLLYVDAYDGGTPALTARAYVKVTVTRNNAAPVVVGTYPGLSVTSADPVGTAITTIVASDNDNNNYRFEIKSESVAASYLYIHPLHGHLTVITTLKQFADTTFHVPIVVTDDGSPPMSSTTTIDVSVIYSVAVGCGNRFIYAIHQSFA